ncbi:hypothetical protein [Kitasatospora sp. NPDC054795]
MNAAAPVEDTGFEVVRREGTREQHARAIHARPAARPARGYGTRP